MNGISLLSGLYIAVGAMLIVVLYHVLFIVVDLRKILRRIESLTAEVEGMVMRPLGIIDHLLQWVIEWIESMEDRPKKRKKK